MCREFKDFVNYSWPYGPILYKILDLISVDFAKSKFFAKSDGFP